ncbi:hypothetical protein [Streptomyces sp. Wb2n-11]|uniref:hypothetical protein n=1 Tax=Streptomyces sp. Wb2n-11 TaxID=1030533 RepID=UPI002100559A|nr:hypothetical protein [Streptomyces sp. Wb2n-11]
MRYQGRRTANSASNPVVLAALAALAVLAAGCGPAEDGKPVPDTAKGSLEQLAAKAECAPDIRTDAAELRQANCGTGDGRYVLATFATDRGQREWINEAKDYGGAYLVGRKWVAAGDREVVTALRGRLGGTVETSSHHSGESGGGGNEEEHSGHHGS